MHIRTILSCEIDLGYNMTVLLSCLLKDEVAVIDEIQMVRDESRGYAWTWAFMGLCADEVILEMK